MSIIRSKRGVWREKPWWIKSKVAVFAYGDCIQSRGNRGDCGDKGCPSHKNAGENHLDPMASQTKADLEELGMS